MKHTSQNIAVYGGTFNPPTLGHMQVMQEILKNTHITHIIMSPSGTRSDKIFGIEDIHRKRMSQICIETLKTQGYSLSLDTHFIDGKHTWLTTTKAEYEYFRESIWEEPTFIFGSDMAQRMHTWENNPDRFVETRLKKIFLHRPGYDFDFEKNDFENYILLAISEMLGVSSTIAREMLRTKQNVEQVLHPNIIQDIAKHHLYL